MNKLIIIIFLSIHSLIGLSQSAQEYFGQNRLQFKNFDWKNISTQNFRIYYYSGGNSIAYNAGRILEKEFSRITDLVGYLPRNKVTIILYNSISDYQQSNIGLVYQDFHGGETDLIKAKIEIPFDGNQVDFKNELEGRFAQLLINLMVFGGNFRDVVQNSYLLSVPDWFTKGAARYIAEGESAEMYNKLQQVVFKKKVDPTKMVGEEAILLGQSIWSYIANEYGEQNIPNILNLTRIVRSERIGISNSLGVDFDSFMNNWKGYYRQKILEKYNEKEEFNKKKRLKRFNTKDVVYSDVKFAPDSNLVAFAVNNKGFFKVFVENLTTGKRKLVHFGGSKTLHETFDPKFPQLSWRSDHELSILYTKKGHPYIATRNINAFKWERKKFNTFDKIIEFDYSSVHDMMVMSASKKGQSDIYFYDYKRDRASQLTRDLYDDKYPVFLSSSKRILFVSNRKNDTLRKEVGGIYDIEDAYYIYEYTWSSNEKKLTRLTNEPLKIRGLEARGTDVYVIVEDSNYQRAMFQFDPEENTLSRYTNFSGNLNEISINKTGQVAFLTSESSREYAYVYDSVLSSSAYEKRQLKKSFSENNNELPSIEIEDEVTMIMNLNVNDYIFESSPSTKETSTQEPEEIKFTIPYDYTGLMGVDYLVSSLVIDPLRGAGAWFESSISDMFSNHRLNASIFALTDLKSSSYSAEYRYLPKRQDYSVMYDHVTVFALSGSAIQRYILDVFEGGIAHPISNALRVAIKPRYMNTRFVDITRSQDIDIVQNYYGATGELVFDNTIVQGLNMIQGTRFKMAFANNRHFNEKERSFTQFTLDFRNYFPIYRDLTFATRISYGSFAGNSPKNYLIGGMDNWLFNRTANVEDDESPLNIDDTDNSDILFVEYATSLRGFDYSELYGNRYMLLNLEARLPVAKFLYDGPISSPFLRNLKFVGFYDWGTAWSGANPFGEDNSFNTRRILSPGFTATTVNYDSPFLYGYGAGIRSQLWGYYAKLDLAWGVQNRVVSRPKLYLTLGYDF